MSNSFGRNNLQMPCVVCVRSIDVMNAMCVQNLCSTPSKETNGNGNEENRKGKRKRISKSRSLKGQSLNDEKKYVSSPSNLRQQQLSNKDTNGIMFASCGESVKNRSVGMKKQRKKMFSFFLSPSFRHRLQLFVWCPFRSARELTLSDDEDNNERKEESERTTKECLNSQQM